MIGLKNTLRGCDFISIHDFTCADVDYFLSVAAELKRMQKMGIPHPYLADKTLAMIFQKASTRTRVAFEVGMYQLGGHALFLSPRDIQLGRGETIKDTALVLARMVDGIMIRTFAQSDVVELAKYSHVPVINGLTDDYHPCQALGDLLTFYEHKGGFAGKKLAFIGDGNNVCHSLMIACTKLGMNISVAHPEGYAPDVLVQEFAALNASKTHCTVEIGADPASAIRGADAVYTDVWASMGQEGEAEARKAFFKPYQVNAALMEHAQPDCIFMHCLPAHVGEEVTHDVMYGNCSVVFEEAENRLHAQKAVMATLMK